MRKIIIKNAKTAEYFYVNQKERHNTQTETQKSFEFKHAMVSSPNATGGKLSIKFFTLMPGNTNYPYHYHTGAEEVFHIISGTATLKTPDGDMTVSEGDTIVFPANANGAHQLTNTSDEALVYLDISTVPSPDVVFFPDKGDFRIITANVSKSFSLDSEVDYLRSE